MSTSSVELSEEETKLFAAIDDSDTVLLKTALVQCPEVNILDENSMTPLQHAAYKGNREMVQILLDHGADPNLCRHQHNYTALHFAGLSGNTDVCLALLMAGAKTNVSNTVNRTAAQMAAFVGHHNCVAIINNFIPKSVVEYYTVPQGAQTKSNLPPFLAESFHKLILQINLHPVKIALNVQNFVGISEHLAEIKKVLQSMSEREMKSGEGHNEVMSFKFHYLQYIIGELNNIRQKPCANDNKDLNVTETFTRKILKPSKDGSLEFLEGLLTECIREFPYRECTLFRQMVSTLASKDPPPALSVIHGTINGQRGFIDNIATCQTCGEEKPAKKCSKCKRTQYCDRNCQRLHWHWHKKVCVRLAQGITNTETDRADTVDLADVSAEVQNLLVGNDPSV